MTTQSIDHPPERQANRFELTGHDQSGPGTVETALARNRAFGAAGGLGLGDAIVARNVGGRVTPAVINDYVTRAAFVPHTPSRGASPSPDTSTTSSPA